MDTHSDAASSGDPGQCSDQRLARLDGPVAVVVHCVAMPLRAFPCFWACDVVPRVFGVVPNSFPIEPLLRQIAAHVVDESLDLLRDLVLILHDLYTARMGQPGRDVGVEKTAPRAERFTRGSAECPKSQICFITSRSSASAITSLMPSVIPHRLPLRPKPIAPGTRVKHCQWGVGWPLSCFCHRVDEAPDYVIIFLHRVGPADSI